MSDPMLRCGFYPFCWSVLFVSVLADGSSGRSPSTRAAAPRPPSHRHDDTDSPSPQALSPVDASRSQRPTLTNLSASPPFLPPNLSVAVVTPPPLPPPTTERSPFLRPLTTLLSLQSLLHLLATAGVPPPQEETPPPLPLWPHPLRPTASLTVQQPGAAMPRPICRSVTTPWAPRGPPPHQEATPLPEVPPLHLHLPRPPPPSRAATGLRPRSERRQREEQVRASVPD